MVHTATGRLWDDHLGHLGYQPKFDRVQDAIFTNSSNYGWHFTSMFSNKHQISGVFEKVTSTNKKNPARQPRHRRPSVYPPTPPFFNKIHTQINKSQKIPKSRLDQPSLFLTLHSLLMLPKWYVA